VLKRVISTLRGRLHKKPGVVFPLTPHLPLPTGISEQQLFNFITSVRVQDAPEAEMRAYGTHDFRRFVYTWGLARDIKGKCLELGGNPYFTTMLLKKFTDLDISLANYFGHEKNGEYTQAVDYFELISDEKKTEKFPFSISTSRMTAFRTPTASSTS